MTSDTSLSIVNGLVFDGQSSEPSEMQVHVENGVVVGLDGAPPPGAETIDARGRLVAPGLIDAHFHAYGVGLDLLQLDALPMSYVAAKAAQRLERALRRGFTTVRDVAGGDLGMVRALDEGVLLGPRYLFVGRALTQTGGHGDPRPGDLEMCLCGEGHMGEVVDGVDDLRRAARERFRTGAHAIKIFTSGGVVSPTDPLRLRQYSAEEIQAVTEEAERRDSYVAAHAYSAEAIVHSVENGVRTIEHGNLIDQAAAELMAGHGAYLIPTLIAYDAMNRRGAELGLSPVAQAKNTEVLDAGMSSLAIAESAGVSIGFGTDLMGDLEADQLEEFRLRASAQPVDRVLRSATSINAEVLGRDDLGRIGLGAAADIVIFDGNPFDRSEVLWAPSRTVIQAGRVIR